MKIILKWQKLQYIDFMFRLVLNIFISSYFIFSL